MCSMKRIRLSMCRYGESDFDVSYFNMRSISRKDYEQFAQEADLFIDEADFLEKAERTGFRIENVTHYPDGTDDNFIAVLRKPSN